MSDSAQPEAREFMSSDAASAPPAGGATAAAQRQQTRRETRRWWIKLIVQPLLLLACGAILIVALGLAQRLGFISAGGGERVHHDSRSDSDARYICPMMCTPPQAEPGRCPVCAMELVPAAPPGGSDSRSIAIDPAARRVANIRTAAVTSISMTRTIRAIGELHYDEGALKTISAYVDGRLDRLYADYTGVVVNRGDPLALLYSPRLYSSQVELLLAKKTRDDARPSTVARSILSGGDLYRSAKERLLLLGMTDAQIDDLEQAGEANSRLQLCAPISGTVIEKLAFEGQYVKEGDVIYRLGDLSNVWLLLQLFPEDAAAVRYGQKVEAEVQSLPGQRFNGRVAFISPSVDPQTRTVAVRVVMPNDEGTLRVGDFARATLDVPLSAGKQSPVYDRELAGKWMSPRHPHYVADSPGTCPICGDDLVPAAKFGFVAEPIAASEALVVPRDAVLMAGDHSVLYVETEPGRFEIRRVVLGPSCGDKLVILSGVERGEPVATRGNFLIDSQMQLAGNPSLIDPTKGDAMRDDAMSAELIAALSSLSPEDRALAQRQRICPVAGYPLGSMGPPQKVAVNGESVFICCEGCRERLLAEPDKYLTKLVAKRGEKPTSEPPTEPPSAAARMDLPPIGVPQIVEPEEHDAGAVPEETTRTDAAPAARRVSELPQEGPR